MKLNHRHRAEALGGRHARPSVDWDQAAHMSLQKTIDVKERGTRNPPQSPGAKPAHHDAIRFPGLVRRAARRLAWRRDAVSRDARRASRAAPAGVQQKNAIFLKFFQESRNFNDLRGCRLADPALRRASAPACNAVRAANRPRIAGPRIGSESPERESPRPIRPASRAARRGAARGRAGAAPAARESARGRPAARAASP